MSQVITIRFQRGNVCLDMINCLLAQLSGNCLT